MVLLKNIVRLIVTVKAYIQEKTGLSFKNQKLMNDVDHEKLVL